MAWQKPHRAEAQMCIRDRDILDLIQQKVTAGEAKNDINDINEVTPQEIQELAQRYLCKETLKEVIAGKKLS